MLAKYYEKNNIEKGSLTKTGATFNKETTAQQDACNSGCQIWFKSSTQQPSLYDDAKLNAW
jgi:hypothetical protein